MNYFKKLTVVFVLIILFPFTAVASEETAVSWLLDILEKNEPFLNSLDSRTLERIGINRTKVNDHRKAAYEADGYEKGLRFDDSSRELNKRLADAESVYNQKLKEN